MKSTMKRALSLILTALMLLMLLPGGMAEEMNTASAPVIPGLSDGGALVSEVLGASAEKTAAELYERLMAAENCQSIYDILGEESLENVEALSAEQLTDLIAYVETLEDDGTKEELIFDLTVLRDGNVENIPDNWYPGGGDGNQGGSSSTGDIDESKYSSSIPVYWDTVTALSQSGTSATYDNVTSVTLGGVSVANGVATNTSWSGGSNLASYFTSASANNMQEATLSITAAEGYYVTGVVVACAPTGGNSKLTPFKCSTWSSGNEYIQSFNLTASTYSDGKYSLSFSINSRYFSHNGATSPNAYFILITVAAVPTPLYVEYNYGNVTDFLTVDSSSGFYNPTWTVAASGNSYGSGSMYANGVLTSDTQFAYQYPSNDTSAIASWTHTANSVSNAALAEAAAAGYYFAGWSVTWYNSCSVSNTKNSCNDNYTMSFSNTYMTGSYSPGDAVQLPTNVRLVAQWAPITLKVTKTVDGLAEITEHANKSNTYTLLLQNLQGGSYVQLQSTGYTITGDGTLTYTFGAGLTDNGQKNVTITPGTYKVVETGNYDLKGSIENAYCTTTYPAETVIVTADGTVQELKVKNTFSSTPATATVTIKKLVEGNMGDRNKDFTFNVAGSSVADVDKSFTLKHNGSKTITVNVGDTITVTESGNEGYVVSWTVTATSATEDELVAQADDAYPTSGTSDKATAKVTEPTTITFTNTKSATPDTGVLLDSLPYVLILAVVVIVIVLSIVRKRRNDD